MDYRPPEGPPGKRDAGPSPKPQGEPDIRKFIRTWGLTMALAAVFLVGVLAVAQFGPQRPSFFPNTTNQSGTPATSTATSIPTASPTPAVVSKFLDNLTADGYTMARRFALSTSASSENIRYEGTASKNGKDYIVSIEISQNAHEAKDTFDAAVAAAKDKGVTGRYEDAYTWAGTVGDPHPAFSLRIDYLPEDNAITVIES